MREYSGFLGLGEIDVVEFNFYDPAIKCNLPITNKSYISANFDDEKKITS